MAGMHEGGRCVFGYGLEHERAYHPMLVDSLRRTCHWHFSALSAEGSGDGDQYGLCLMGDVPEVMIRAGMVRKNPETGRMVLRIR